MELILRGSEIPADLLEFFEPIDPHAKSDVFKVPTSPCKEAHFAVFPPKLIEPCILAGSRPGDVVLDPFFGAGTSGVVCESLGRDCIGIELNPAYVEIAERRIRGYQAANNQSELAIA